MSEAYGQLDGSASYEFLKGFTVFVEGINLTGASRRGHMRHVNNVTFVSPGFARYYGGRAHRLGRRVRSAATAAASAATASAAATAATQTCPDGSVILATDACPAPPPPPPPPPPAPERGG